ncbi:MAG: TonB-dependent receptor [Mucilaginibacter sp.]
MNKDLLFNKLNSSKKTLFVFLFTLFTCFAAVAQTRQVTGTVSDADGTVIPGAGIKIKGTSTGTVTDVNGTFKLAVPDNATLVISFVGYVTKEVTVGSGSVYNVKLAPAVSNLNEVVVVSVGYGTQKRTDLTGSISSVSAATIAKLPVTSLEQSLQGRAAGVQVTNNDASPGGNVSILIRGTGSLASNGNAPLYVVDGYPVNTGINNINPGDIASIDILKDASATAIYGVRAANGVVIITTKRGKKDGSTQVDVTAYSSFQSRPKEYDLLNAQQFATLALQVAADDPAKQFTTLANWSNPQSLTNADWQNALYRNGLTQNYGIAIRGGNEKVQSSASIGYYDQKGIVLGSYFKRLTAGFNIDYQATKWLKSSSSAKYTYQDSNNPLGTGSLGTLAQLVPTLDGGNSQTSQISDGKGNYGFYNPLYTYVAKNGNPVYSINTNEFKNITNYFLVNSSLEATVYDGLKIKTNAGVNYNGYSGTFFQPSDGRLIAQYGAAAGATGNAFYSQHINSTFDWLWENTISYDKTFGKHTINFVGGISEQETTYNAMGGSVIPPNNTIRDLNQGTNLLLDRYGNGQVIRSFESQFARLSYNYEGKYFITGTIRRDGSSQFAPGHQYGNFPSGAVSWKAKEESFLKNVDWLTNLKLRGSWGRVGNQHGIGDFTYQSLYTAGSAAATSGNLGYPFGKSGGDNGLYQGGIAASQPENDNLRWETDEETDIGADISFLHGDLSFTVDYFNRKSKDFLLNIASSIQGGYPTRNLNIGSMDNKGWEFAVNYGHSTSSDFHYDLGLTLSFINNRLTSLTSGTNFIQNFGGLALTSTTSGDWDSFTRTYIGHPVGEFYGYKSIGIFQDANHSGIHVSDLNAAAKAKGFDNYYKAKTGPGDRIYEDTNHDGHITADDQVSLGSPQPKFFGGFTLGATYKAFDFNAFFYGVYGNKILNYAESNLESFAKRGSVSIENVSQQYYKNAWTPNNPSNRYTVVHYNDTDYGDLVPSSVWIENGSFLKLKTLTVGYSLPTDMAKKLTLSKIRVYVSSQNLFTITKYTGLDPEIGVQGGNATQNGVDNGTYPSSRFYTVGLNVTF